MSRCKYHIGAEIVLRALRSTSNTKQLLDIVFFAFDIFSRFNCGDALLTSYGFRSVIFLSCLIKDLFPAEKSIRRKELSSIVIALYRRRDLREQLHSVETRVNFI